LSSTPITATEAARTDPQAFLQITRESWKAENAVIQRILARGLTAAATALSDQGVEFLDEDSRRLYLGDHRSDQIDSIELVAAIAPLLATEQRKRLELIILSASEYRKEVVLDERQAIWDREARLRLLKAIPGEYLSAETVAIVKSEEQALPDWNRERIFGRSGLVRERLPVSPAELLTAPDEHLLEMLKAPDTRDGRESEWIEEDKCWERPAGSEAIVGALGKTISAACVSCSASPERRNSSINSSSLILPRAVAGFRFASVVASPAVDRTPRLKLSARTATKVGTTLFFTISILRATSVILMHERYGIPRTGPRHASEVRLHVCMAIVQTG
jgi:hypothetical protein